MLQEWFQLQKMHCILPKEMSVKEWVQFRYLVVIAVKSDEPVGISELKITTFTFTSSTSYIFRRCMLWKICTNVLPVSLFLADFKCAHCGRTFTDASECAHHGFREHVPKQFACAWCGKYFGALHHLTFHSAAAHGRVMVADATGSYTVERVIDELLKRVNIIQIVCGLFYYLFILGIHSVVCYVMHVFIIHGIVLFSVEIQ